MKAVNYECGCIIKAESLCFKAKDIIRRLESAHARYKDNEFEEILQGYYAHYRTSRIIKQNKRD